MKLNGRLQPENTPVTTRSIVSGYQFDAQNERNAVSRTHIKDFSFTSGIGGTLTLGGVNNGNGILSVVDSGGTQKVLVNNTGIQVNDGKIQLYNSEGSLTFDASGLVSNTNFQSDFYSDDTTIDDPGSSFVDIPGSSLSFTLDRTTNVMIAFFAYAEVIGNAEDTAYIAQMCVNVDGTDESPYAQLLYEMTTGAHGIRMGGNLSSTRLYTLASGSHTIKLRARGISTYVRIGSRNLNYIVLGT